jgi:hypothetical protein
MARKQNMVKVFSKSQETLTQTSVNKHMRVVGNRMKCPATEHINMVMELYIVANGKRINSMVKVNINFQMEQFMMDNGKII